MLRTVTRDSSVSVYRGREPVAPLQKASESAELRGATSLNVAPETFTARVLWAIPFLQHPLYSSVYPVHCGVVPLFQSEALQDPHLLDLALHERSVGMVFG